jgi:hypothetical protein
MCIWNLKLEFCLNLEFKIENSKRKTKEIVKFSPLPGPKPAQFSTVACPHAPPRPPSAPRRGPTGQVDLARPSPLHRPVGPYGQLVGRVFFSPTNFPLSPWSAPSLLRALGISSSPPRVHRNRLTLDFSPPRTASVWTGLLGGGFPWIAPSPCSNRTRWCYGRHGYSTEDLVGGCLLGL